MTSGRQKRERLKSERQRKSVARAEKQKRAQSEIRDSFVSADVLAGALPVSAHLLAFARHFPSIDFMRRGTYRDFKFTCIDCGNAQVWTAGQQKWWYEVAHGDLSSTAVRCRPCRRVEQIRKAEARRVHLEGVKAKRQTGR